MRTLNNRPNSRIRLQSHPPVTHNPIILPGVEVNARLPHFNHGKWLRWNAPQRDMDMCGQSPCKEK